MMNQLDAMVVGVVVVAGNLVMAHILVMVVGFVVVVVAEVVAVVVGRVEPRVVGHWEVSRLPLYKREPNLEPAALNFGAA